MSDKFRHSFRVRYSEVDPQSVVFNSRYLEYADLVLTEYWRAQGLHFSGAGALEFHVVRAEIDFIAPIRADEMIGASAVTQQIGTSSITTIIELYGEGDERDLRARIMLVHVHVDLDDGRPLPVPQHARAALGAIEQGAPKENVDG